MSQIVSLPDNVLERLEQITNQPSSSSIPVPQIPGVPNEVAQMLQASGVDLSKANVTKPLETPITSPTNLEHKYQNNGIESKPLRQIETFVVILPSQGKLYPQGNSFQGVDKVQLRKMDIFDDDILSSETLGKNNAIYSTLLKSVFINKQLDPDDLFEGDRQALIVGLRSKSYGKMYNSKLKYRCDFCQVPGFEWTFDLESLTTLDKTDKYKHSHNNFVVTLPCGKEAVLKLFTVKDAKRLQEVVTTKNNQAIQSGIDRTESTSIREHILALDGVTEPMEIDTLMLSLGPVDKKFIFQFLDKIEPKLNFNPSIKCPGCGAILERTIFFTDEFLNPTIFEI